MTTTLEDRKNSWLKAQPKEVQLGTVLVEALAKYLDQNSPEYVAAYLADCLKNKVWEHGFWAVASDGSFYVWKSANALDFIRDRFKMEPAMLMNIIASPLPKAEDGAAAAIELVKQVKANEPETFAVLLDKDNPRNWRDLLTSNEKREGGPWIKAAAELDKASVARQFGAIDHEILQKAKDLYKELGSLQKVADRLGVTSSTVHNWLKGKRVPYVSTKPLSGTFVKTRSKGTPRQQIRRKLERYAISPDLCAEKGTTVERVKEALIDFHNGKSAASCERKAGLAPPKKERHAQIHPGTEASKAATDLIKYVGADKAREIANAINEQLTLRAVA